MKEVKVLGTGCAGCRALYAMVEKNINETGVEANLTKEEDIVKIMEYNVMTLPALVIDGKVVAKGKITSEQVRDLLTK
ncbi:MAG: thioredoxin family protein [Candidatus Limimorpha sp.]